MRHCLIAYDPLQVLKPVAPDLWIIDGPEIRMRYAGLHLPFTTRATVLRLADGRLLVHSPVPLTPALREAVEALGTVSWLVSPNRCHYAFLAEWQRAWPDALTAGIAREKLWNGEAARFALDLAGAGPFPWAPEIEHLVIPGVLVSEAVFHHAASGTLVVTDLVQNFEKERVCRAWLRWLLALDSFPAEDGGTPFDLRGNFRRDPGALQAAGRRIERWAPERVILAHGRCFEQDGAARIARALAWI